jgi:non-specific protein-tyrosine kinase
LATVIGALLAAGGVMVAQYLDDRVKTEAEAERLAGAPSLGVLAADDRLAQARKLVTVVDSHSPAAEAYRMIAARIELTAADNPVRTMVITDAIAAEGTSLAVANLAVALAQIGKRVVLVDANLRQPQLHRLFQRANRRGVSTALAEPHDYAVRELMLRTDVDTLYLIPSGPLPLNPAALLGSPRLVRLIEELTSEADVVLFDTPAVLDAVDATLVASACDAVFLMARPSSTPAAALVSAKEHLLHIGAPLLGLIINRQPVRQHSVTDYIPFGHSRWLQRLLPGWPHRRNGVQPGAASPLDVSDITEASSD